ncbi:MAG TPA: G5 domain-containing protein [Candidatus Saccharimonadales bacterium]|nr:G5 domain-containing protein [Candidatus Saccharimonadales bacterium]
MTADKVNLNLYGAVTEQRTQSKTVKEFLEEKSLSLQEGDILLQSPDQAITDGITVEIKNDSREVLVSDEEIPMPEDLIKDVNKDTGYRQVQSAGYTGQKRVTYEIKKINGKEISRTVVNEEVIKPALKQTTIVGARKVVTSKVSGSSRDWLAAASIPESQWGYVDHIISKESGWNYTARNRSSGAYGLCQALPGSKMASAGSDWQTNPVTQLRWCNSYANARYGGWAGAYSFWLAKRWW